MRGLIGKKKKGAAHFEMIFAFVFFTGFVFFLFVVLKPQDTSTLSGSVIAALYDSFEEEVSTNLSSMFLKANYTGGQPCFNISLPGQIFAYAIADGDSYVTYLNGTSASSDLTASGGNGKLEIRHNSKNFFRVSLSPEFNDTTLGGCGDLNDYQLGNVLERKVVSSKALTNMSNEYFRHYENLRIKLRVPPIFDFAVTFETMTTLNMLPQHGIPDSVEVQARDYVVEVLNSTGDLFHERITLRIW